MRNFAERQFESVRGFNKTNRQPGISSNRAGFSYAEVLVCAAMLTTIMSLVTVSSFRISRVWKDIRQQKVALSELSNQLDRLTALPVEQVKGSISKLKPSEACLDRLTQPKISGVVQDQADFGQRLTVSITWQSHTGDRSRPVQMSAWWAEPGDGKGSQQ